MMNVTINEEQGRLRVELAGRLDTVTSTEFLERVQQAFRPECPDITVDCRQLDYISSSGLRSWMTLHKTAALHGGRLSLRNLNPQILDVLNMTGLVSVFHIE